jgi:phage terminase small subunit
MPAKPGLSFKQAAFVREYLKDFNGTQAAIRAGYSEKTAESQASTLLRNPKIGSAIRADQAKTAEITQISKAYLVEQLVWNLHQCREAKDRQVLVRTVDLLAKMHGHIVERRDVRIIRNVEDLSDEELAALEAQARQAAEAQGTRH